MTLLTVNKRIEEIPLVYKKTPSFSEFHRIKIQFSEHLIRSYDTFRSRLAISRNLWITGIVSGILAACVGTVYTYEAILIQRRKASII